MTPPGVMRAKLRRIVDLVVALLLGIGVLALNGPFSSAAEAAPGGRGPQHIDDRHAKTPINPAFGKAQPLGAPPGAPPLNKGPRGIATQPSPESSTALAPESVSQVPASDAVASAVSGCSSSTLDLRLLVLSANGQEADLSAIRQALDGMGTPYTLWIATQKPGQLTPGQLSTTCHGFYQGVIVTNGLLGYTASNGSWVQSALTSTEWQNLHAYESAFHVRQLSWYSYPTPDIGFNWPTSGVDTTSTTLATHLTQQGKAVFPYVQPNAIIPIQGAWTYLATPLTDGATTTLLTDNQGDALAGIRSYSDGRQLLSLTFDDNSSLIQDLVLWYGLIDWVTNGLFIGERQTFLSPQDDDLLSPGAMWLPGTPCGTMPEATGSGYRTTGSDLTALLNWQKGIQSQTSSRQVAISFAFIGAWSQPGAYTPDTLTPVVEANASQFRWINHTYEHPDFDTIDYPTALAQVQSNNTVAAQLGLPGYLARDLVTPGYTGLTNPAAMQAAFDAGVRSVATDVYSPGYANPTPDAGLWITGSYSGKSYQLLGLPRRLTNLYWDVSTPAQWLDQDHCQWPAGQFGYAATYADLLARESSVILKYMLWGDVDALAFHALNVRSYDGVHSLLSDLLDKTLQQYNALVTFPIVSLTMDQVATQMTNRMAFNAAQSRVSANVVSSATGSTLHISSPIGTTVPVTGVPASQGVRYGTSIQADVPVSTNGSVSIPLSGATVTLRPVADTYILASAPTSTAAGSSTELQSDVAGGTTAFLRFDLTSLAGRTVTSATLRLHTSAETWAGSSITHNIHFVSSNTWQEASTSYSNTVPASSIGGTLGTILGPSPGTWYASTALDTATLQKHVGSLLSISIDAPARDVLTFYSRESGTATAPQLVINYR